MKPSTLNLLFCSTALLCSLAPRPIMAQSTEAATRDPHVMKLASDGQVGFLDVVRRLEGKVPWGATVVLDMQGMDRFTRATLTEQLLSTGAARIVERDALGAERTISSAQESPGDATDDDAGSGDSERVFDLPVENLQVRAAEDSHRWQPPQHLVQMSLYKNPHGPTAALFLPSDEEPPAKPLCLSVRSIDASDGTIAWMGLSCGTPDKDQVEAASAALLTRAASESSSLRAGQRVLQLPVEVHDGENTQLLTVENRLYHSVNNALAKRGCHVLDVPPKAAAGGRDGERWSYHDIPFEPVTTTRIEGWVQARYSLQIHARNQSVQAAQLVASLDEMDPQLIDPDLVLMKPDASVPVSVLDLEAVDLSSGRILVSAEVSTGQEISREVIAEVTAGLLFGGRAQSWLELRPIPQTAAVKVDRADVRIVDGLGFQTLRPGKHKADLVLEGSSKPDATARFRMDEYQYGVLPLAAPFGTLAVASTPEGAEVFVDGQPWGPSPVERTVGGGSHEVSARVEGCGEQSREVEVLIGERNETLLHLPGFLEAAVLPPRANISVNDVAAGSGQAEAKLPFGGNDVTYSLAGYPDRHRSVMIDSCETTKDSFRFDGTIVTSSDPKGAEVRIDGEPVGRSVSHEVVSIGTHVVSCHWCEYGSGSREVEVGPGQEVPVDIELDGSGFRVLVGPYAGFLASPQLDTEGGLRVGAMAEAWLNGRWGLQLLGDLGTGQSYQHFAVGPTVRTLFPAPGLALPISLRADMIRHRGDGLTVFPSLGADLRICVGKAAALRIGGHGGYGPRGGFLGGASLGITWRSNSPWKDEE